jgi:hypothetical protein
MQFSSGSTLSIIALNMQINSVNDFDTLIGTIDCDINHRELVQVRKVKSRSHNELLALKSFTSLSMGLKNADWNTGWDEHSRAVQLWALRHDPFDNIWDRRA